MRSAARSPRAAGASPAAQQGNSPDVPAAGLSAGKTSGVPAGADTLAGRGGGHQPITLGIYHDIGDNDQQWNAIMATAVIASILLVVAQHHVAAGVTAGAVTDREGTLTS